MADKSAHGKDAAGKDAAGKGADGAGRDGKVVAGATLIGVALALASATAYGFNTPLTRLAALHGVMPVDAIFARATLMMVVSGVVMGVTGHLFDIPRKAWPVLCMLACATGTLSLCYLSSVAFIPVGLAAIIFFTFPVTVLVLAPWFEGAPVAAWRFGLAAVAFSGLAVAIGPSLDRLDGRGLALAFIASLAAAGQFFAGRKLRETSTSLSFIFWVHVIFYPVILAALWAFGHGWQWLQPGPLAIFSIAGLIPVAVLSCTFVIGYGCQMTALGYVKPSIITPVYNIEPVVSASAAALLVGEVMTWPQYLGGLIVFASLVTSALIGARTRRQDIVRTGPLT